MSQSSNNSTSTTTTRETTQLTNNDQPGPNLTPLTSDNGKSQGNPNLNPLPTPENSKESRVAQLLDIIKALQKRIASLEKSHKR